MCISMMETNCKRDVYCINMVHTIQGLDMVLFVHFVETILFLHTKNCHGRANDICT